MKHVLKWIIVIPIVAGIVIAGWMTAKNQVAKFDEINKNEKIFGSLAGKDAIITKFFTYGSSFNVEGVIKGISKDNFEGIKLLLTDGGDFEKNYNLSYSFDEQNLSFSTELINNSVILDELPIGKYYVQVRVKVNNSKDYKYYTLLNSSSYKNIEYYTITKEDKNNKINIKFGKEIYNEKEYNCLSLNISEAKLPNDVYDIAIDCGHGGTDPGETNGGVKESDLMLEYGKELKNALEEKGYKVKLVRDDSNTSSFNDKNMYDENGRISNACKTKAKYMISLHTGESGYSGIQVYVPNNVDLKLASKLASNIYNNSSLEFSANKDYKKQEGIYQKNYNKDSIARVKANLEKQGIEPYNLTNNTPNLYTIREVGGIATNAYVDGRNPNYGTNAFYNSNQGIECYQISIGSLKKDKEILQNEKEQIVQAIADCF